jgi:hypothetical protein
MGFCDSSYLMISRPFLIVTSFFKQILGLLEIKLFEKKLCKRCFTNSCWATDHDVQILGLLEPMKSSLIYRLNVSNIEHYRIRFSLGRKESLWLYHSQIPYPSHRCPLHYLSFLNLLHNPLIFVSTVSTQPISKCSL